MTQPGSRNQRSAAKRRPAPPEPGVYDAWVRQEAARQFDEFAHAYLHPATAQDDIPQGPPAKPATDPR